MGDTNVSTLFSLALGGVAGYTLGKGSIDASPTDAHPDATAVASLTQRVNLLNAQVEVQAALLAAEKDQSAIGLAVQAALREQIGVLDSRLSQQQVNLFNRFPAMLGPGDPGLAGWILGRDGLLVNRVLPNFIPANSLIGVQSGYTPNVEIASPMSVSDITTTLPPRPVTIGRAVNASLRVSHYKGIFPSMATIFNFEENVADDPDFVVAVSGYGAPAGYPITAIAVPVGQKSLMVIPLAMSTLPPGYTLDDWKGIVLRDYGSVTAVGTPSVSQRQSYLASGANGYRIALSHRTVRNLTLKSWTVCASPIASWLETSRDDLTDQADMQTRRQGDVTVVTRLNTGLVPKFYRANGTGAYDSVAIAPSTYM